MYLYGKPHLLSFQQEMKLFLAGHTNGLTTFVRRVFKFNYGKSLLYLPFNCWNHSMNAVLKD